MGTYPPSKVSHGDITPTEGQAWGHPPTEHQGVPHHTFRGAARYMGTSSPLKVGHGDIVQPNVRGVSPYIWGEPDSQGHTPTESHGDKVSHGERPAMGTLPPSKAGGQAWGHTSGVVCEQVVTSGMGTKVKCQAWGQRPGALERGTSEGEN